MTDTTALPISCNTDDIERKIIDILARESLIEREKLTPDATLESLGLASVDVLHVLLGIEEEFDIYLPVDGLMAESKNIGELMKLLTELVKQKKQAC
jgi:acyl carrier protein